MARSAGCGPALADWGRRPLCSDNQRRSFTPAPLPSGRGGFPALFAATVHLIRTARIRPVMLEITEGVDEAGMDSHVDLIWEISALLVGGARLRPPRYPFDQVRFDHLLEYVLNFILGTNKTNTSGYTVIYFGIRS